MPTQVTCPACGRVLRVPDSLFGQQVKCPGCFEQFTAAGTPPEAPPDSPPPRDESYRAAGDPSAPRDDAPPGHDRFRESPDGPILRRVERPRLDDDDDDDDDDYPRRRRRGPSREALVLKVSSPANGLLAVGIIGVVLTVLGFAMNGAQLANAPAGAGQEFIFINIGTGAFHLMMSVLIIIGAQKMKKLESYGLAKAAAIVAMIPLISPCCLLGLVFGIQCLNVLNDADVRNMFDRPPEDERPRYDEDF